MDESVRPFRRGGLSWWNRRKRFLRQYGDSASTLMALEPRILLAADLQISHFPVGWDGPLLLSNATGTTTDDFPLLSSAAHVYVDLSVRNDGNASAGAFAARVRLLDANSAMVSEQTLNRATPVSAGAVALFTDVDFGMLAAGIYTLEVTVDVNGTVAENDETDNVATRTFAVIAPATISGIKWNDANGDGIKDAGESVLVGKTIYLDLDEDGTLDVGEPNMPTDASGSYSFTVAPGTYRVAEVVESGWQQTLPGPEGGLKTGFDVDIRFIDGSLTAAQQAVILNAAARWEQVIIGDLPDFYTSPIQNRPDLGYLNSDLTAGLFVDDILIDAYAGFIDDLGETLGQGGPFPGPGRDRPGANPLPTRGSFQLDTADLPGMSDQELFEVALHEIGHALGLGTLWDDFGFINATIPSDKRFTGPNATQQYNQIFNSAETSIPIENNSAHWRESVLDHELMTPTADTLERLSRITIGSLQDLGYTVDYSQADTYVAPARTALPVVSITAIDAQANEAGGNTGQFRIERRNAAGALITSGALSVAFTISGTAAHGTDYASISTSVVIPDGSSSVTITVTPTDDAGSPQSELTETVVLTLNANSAFTVGSPNAATVSILDNEPKNLNTPSAHRLTVRPGEARSGVNFGNQATAVPPAPSQPDLDSTSDSGALMTDNITNDNTPTFIGTAEAGSTVKLFSSVAGQVGTATANGSGAWTIFASTLTNGVHQITATATNAQGSTGPASTALAVTIDVAPPTVTVTPLITTDRTPALTGTVSETAAAIQVTVNGSSYPATNNGNGTWTLANNAITPALAVGTYNVSVSATDPAGNVGTDASTNELVINNTPPTLTSMNTFAGATEDSPFTIQYSALLSAGNEQDADGDPISFRVEAISSGTLTKGGMAVTPGVTTVIAGDSLVWTPAANTNGTLAAFTVRASDGLAFSASPVQVNVIVTPTNDLPTLTSVSTLTGVTEDTPFTITYAALAAAASEGDIDGDTVSFRIEQVFATGSLTKGGVAVTPGTTLLSPGETWVWTPAANFSGTTDAFRIKAFDGQAASVGSGIVVAISVEAANDAPTLTTVSTLIGATEDTGYTITFSALASAANEADADGTSPHFIIQQVLAGTLLKGGSPVLSPTSFMSGETLSWTSPANASGTIGAFSIVAADVSLGISSPPVTVTVNVAAANDPPTLDPISSPAPINENAGLQTVNLSGISAGGGESQALQVTVSSGNTNLILAPTVTYTSPSATGSLSYTPIVNQSGVAVIFVTVTDGGLDGNLGTSSDNASFTQQFTVAVNSVNSAPVLNNAGSPTLPSIPEDSSNPLGTSVSTIVIDGSMTDADGPAVEAIAVTSASSVNGQWQYSINGGLNWQPLSAASISGAILLNPGYQVQFLPNANFNGTASFSYRAWDQSTGGGGMFVDTTVNGGTTAFSTAIETASITVTPVNDAPTLTAVNTFTGGTEDLPYTITRNAMAIAADEADVDGDLVAFRIEAITNGALTKGGVPVVPGVTLFSVGHGGSGQCHGRGSKRRPDADRHQHPYGRSGRCAVHHFPRDARGSRR